MPGLVTRAFLCLGENDMVFEHTWCGGLMKVSLDERQWPYQLTETIGSVSRTRRFLSENSAWGEFCEAIQHMVATLEGIRGADPGEVLGKFIQRRAS